MGYPVEMKERCLSKMGARFAVLTTRHEEGFCLWPNREQQNDLPKCRQRRSGNC